MMIQINLVSVSQQNSHSIFSILITINLKLDYSFFDFFILDSRYKVGSKLIVIILHNLRCLKVLLFAWDTPEEYDNGSLPKAF